MKYITVKLTEDQHRTICEMVLLERFEQEVAVKKGHAPQYYKEQIAYLRRLEKTLRTSES